MIANCPSCGTHYKHEPPAVAARARCGRCDATLDLSRLRPYRIQSLSAADPADTARAARHLPIGLDHPALATTIARNVERRTASAQPVVAALQDAPAPTAEPPVAFEIRPGPAVTPGVVEPLAAAPVPAETWDEAEPLPAIPEMGTFGAFEPSVPPVSESDILEASEAETDEAPIAASSTGSGERATTFALWLAAGAIVGTGTSWTMGGTTLTGVLAGGVLGAVTGWGWLRWMSSK